MIDSDSYVDLNSELYSDNVNPNYSIDEVILFH